MSLIVKDGKWVLEVTDAEQHYTKEIATSGKYVDRNIKVDITSKTGELSTNDSTISGNSFTPTLAYNSSTSKFDFSGSANATGTAYAKASTDGYVTSSNNVSKSLSATVSATGSVDKVGLGSTNSGVTSAVTPVISKQAISITGVTDAANGDATTTAPTSGVYVKVKSAENKGNLISTPKVTSAGYGTTTSGQYSASTASSEVGANASADTYVPIKTGSATTPATTIDTATPSISVDANGLISASVSTSKSVTPTVSAGWVSSGTAGTVSVSGSNTEQLSTQAETTFNVSSTNQTISAGKYTTGTQTIRAVTTSGISASNIKDGAIVKVGDAADDDRIISVTGTFTDASTVSSGQTAASAGDLRSGYSAFIDGAELKGSMPNNVAETTTITTQGGEYTIPTGYHTGSGKVKAQITASVLDNSIISGQAFEEATGDYAWKSTVSVPAGYHNAQTLEKTFSEIFPAPETPGTASEVLLGYQFYNKSGKLITGTMPNNTSWSGSISTQGASIDIPNGYHNGSTVTANINNGVIKSPDTAATISTPTYDSTSGKFTQSASGTIASPSVTTAGYISDTAGTKNTGSISGSKTLDKITGTTTISGTTKVTPAISKQTISISGVTDAASGDATTTAPTSGVYVKVKSAAASTNVTASPSITAEGYGTSTYHGIASSAATEVGANASADTYVPITTTSASVSGPTVSYESGWISSGSKTVDSGTAGTPTATKSSTNANSVSVIPSVTNTTGWIIGSTISGTAVTVSASEVVSGTYDIPSSSTSTIMNITNYANVSTSSIEGVLTELIGG